MYVSKLTSLYSSSGTPHKHHIAPSIARNPYTHSVLSSSSMSVIPPLGRSLLVDHLDLRAAGEGTLVDVRGMSFARCDGHKSSLFR